MYPFTSHQVFPTALHGGFLDSLCTFPTDKSKGTLCFKDSSYAANTIPPVVNVTCTVHGQYVIYYNERLPGVTYPPDYHPYAYDLLCEVEVYGKNIIILWICQEFDFLSYYEF